MQEVPSQDWSLALGGDVHAASQLWESVGQDPATASAPAVDVQAAWQRLQIRMESVSVTPGVEVVQPKAPAIIVPLAQRHTTTNGRNWRLYLYAAAAAVALLVLANTLSGIGEKDHYFVNGGNSALTIVLEDQSRVQLSPASEINFAADESGRQAVLTGSASFVVAPDRQRPFTVQAGSMEVLVVGTQFELSAGNPAQLTVSEGHVRARGAREADWIDLYAGDQAESVDGLLTATGPSIGLRFEDEPLGAILRAVAEVHQVKLDAPAALLSCQLTVSLDGLDLAESLQTLSLLTGAQVVSKGQNYSLVGGSCR